MALLNLISQFKNDTIHTKTSWMEYMYKSCRLCKQSKELNQYYKLRNACKDCLNLGRRYKYPSSICLNCNQEFRPDVQGRYKFCNEICRFMNKVEKDLITGCWNWLGELEKDWGYGKFVPHGGKSGLAHRSSYRLFRGPITPGKLILHACHRPQCVAPDHLREGTNADNAKDKSLAGRCNPKRGHRNLTVQNISEIELLSKQGFTHKYIADQLNVSRPLISQILRNIKE